MVSKPLIKYRDPQPHEIRIDDIDLSTHPDLSIRLTFGKEGERRTIRVILEVGTELYTLSLTNAVSSVKNGITSFPL